MDIYLRRIQMGEEAQTFFIHVIKELALGDEKAKLIHTELSGKGSVV